MASPKVRLSESPMVMLRKSNRVTKTNSSQPAKGGDRLNLSAVELKPNNRCTACRGVIADLDSRRCQNCGRPIRNRVALTSFWTIHYFPPFGSGLCRVAVWRHRGWQPSQPPVPCSDGWAVEHNTITVVTTQVLFVVSSYDFEYRNRRWMSPLP